jgi:hypothetical protein
MTYSTEAHVAALQARGATVDDRGYWRHAAGICTVCVHRLGCQREGRFYPAPKYECRELGESRAGCQDAAYQPAGDDLWEEYLRGAGVEAP